MPPPTPPTASAPIAIVGRACELPGASTPGELWQAVVEGRDLITQVPSNRWGIAPEHILCQNPHDSVDRTWSDRGGYVTGFADRFDPTGFAVAAETIVGLDPVTLWTLHTAREALRDAGWDTDRGQTARTGAVFGNLSFPSASMAAFTERATLRSVPGYGEDELSDAALAHAGIEPTDPRNRFNSGFPALLLERALGLDQGALALDAACASSLYAIKLACDRLADGEADLMLAGAVNCADDLCIHLGFAALTALSRTGRSRPFHAEADGLVPAEGCGFVALRRLDDAVADGDHIHGIIEGIGLSNDGRGRGFLVPSAAGQARAMTAALDAAGVHPSEISLLECHATGTTVGDATEIASSAEVYHACTDLPIGSLKSNTGHLITAAGVAGLIKVTEAMAHQVRPPTNHVEHPLAELADSPFRLLTAPEPWELSDTDPAAFRRAGVSAFGFGGNNAHLIVSEPAAAAALLKAPPGKTSAGIGNSVGRPSRSEKRAPLAIVGIGVLAASATDRQEFTSAMVDNAPALNAQGSGSIESVALDLVSQKFPPKDLDKTLPQQLAMLAVADEAISDCRPAPTERTGVYVGMGTDPEAARFGIRWRLATRAAAWGADADWLDAARDSVGPPLDAPAVLGTMPNIVANRLNSQHDLAGPSFAVSSEEHSGLDALAIARRALQAGEIDAALVGAVDFCCQPVHQAAAEAVLEHDRQVPGDAAVALVLKRLDDAQRDGDRLYAILPADLERPIEEPVGDLRLGLGRGVRGITHLFGHAHAASGLLHVAAAANLLHHRVELGGTPLLASNPASGPGLGDHCGPRSATVTVEAMEGITPRSVLLAEANGHQAPVRAAVDGSSSPITPTESTSAESTPTRSPAPRCFVFAAASPKLLVDQLAPVEQLGRTAIDQPTPSATAGPVRLAIVAASDEQLRHRCERARHHIETGAPSGPGAHYQPRPIAGGVAFVFTAAGAAYHGMGAELLRAMPELIDDVSATFPLGDTAGWIYRDPTVQPNTDDFLWGTSLLTAAHAHLTQQLLGLKPNAAIGYSSGESNSLFCLGAWSDRDAMRAEIAASGMMGHELGGEFAAIARAWGEPTAAWAQWNVLAPIANVAQAIASEPRVHLAIINTANDAIIAGDPVGCDRVVRRLGPTRCRRVHYNLACHVPEVAQAFHQAWVDVHTRNVTPVPGVRFYSNGINASYEPSPARCAEVITAQAETTLDFPATIEAAYADGIRIFIEHGPAGACTNFISETLRGREFLAVALDRRDHNLEQLFEVAAALTAAGVPVAHEALTERLSTVEPPRAAPAATVRHFTAHPDAVHLPPRPGKIESTITMTPQPPAPDFHDEARPAQQMAPAPRLPALATLGGVTDQFGSPVPRGAAEPDPIATVAHPTPTLSLSSVNADPVVAHHPIQGLIAQIEAQVSEVAAIHGAFLHQRATTHTSFLAAAHGSATVPTTQPAPPIPNGEATDRSTRIANWTEPSAPNPTTPVTPTDSEIRLPKWDKAELEIHSSGRIADLFGERFAAQASRRVQCRMPEPPLLLADRVMDIDATIGELGTGTIWTETDVIEGAWYLNDGFMPAGFMIESGQADLMLISYMGIDLITSEDRAYRLLGCTLTYHGDLPSPGETLAYEIRITGHARHGDVRLFFFEYDCTVDGQPRLTVRGGQAGFFNPAELADALGVLWTPEEAAGELDPDARVDPPAVAITKSAFTTEEVTAFSEGRIVDCFGADFAWTQTHTRTPKIQGQDQLFIDEVSHFDPAGGPWGRGFMRCETAISPDAWFFDGHFKNDPCMPGNFMVEACIEAMSFYLAAMGFTLKRDGWRFQPLTERAFELKCRGEINPRTQQVAYELHVREIWAGPHPTIICDVLGFVDGKAAFHAHEIGVELVPSWPLTSMPELTVGADESVAVATDGSGFPFDWKAMLSCAWGRPSEAFGSMYEVFDGVRRSPRLPGPPYHFISRITEIDGELGDCRAGMEIVCEYDIPADAWYFDENGAETMPFAVLLEAALQPCGWVASAIGSASGGDADLLFRNLDGTGTQTAELTRTAGVLTTKVKITGVSRAAGMVIETFEVLCFLGDRLVYTMDTVFGFFPPEAFDSQVGLAIADEDQAVLELDAPPMIDLRDRPDRFFGGAPRLAQPMLLMLDRAVHVPSAGRAGLGVVRGEKDVDVTEWFFKAHFFQDPVQPGSLGVEALLQLLQFFMIDTGMGDGAAGARFEPIMIDAPLTWTYRGQVTPDNTRITTVMEITEVGQDDRGHYVIGTGSLWCDGLRIYEVKNMGMRIAVDESAEIETTEARLEVESKTEAATATEAEPEGSADTAAAAGAPDCTLPVSYDKAEARSKMSAYWSLVRGTPRRWLGDDLLDGLVERYVGRIQQERAGLVAGLGDRPVLYLANHQVQLESLLISNLLPALTGTPMTTIANAKHQQRWIGELIQALESYPDAKVTEQIVYFDQSNPQAMFDLIDAYRAKLAAGPHSMFVHVDGTRSQSCRQSTQRCSSVFVDLAVECDLAIVPVRFTGGLPVKPIEGKSEFPAGHSRQDYWIGTPIEPEVLAALGLRERVDLVVDAINTLSGANADEQPLAPDPARVARTAAWQERTGVHEVYAGCWQILADCTAPSRETLTLRQLAAGATPDDPRPTNGWMARTAELFLGATPPATIDSVVTLDRETQPQLIDHVVDHDPVVPLAYVVEWMARAAERMTGARSNGRPAFPIELVDFRVLNGLVLNGFDSGGSAALELVVGHDTPTEGTTIALRDPGSTRPRYRSRLLSSTSPSASLSAHAAAATAAATTPTTPVTPTPPTSAESIYGQSSVLFHGPRFQVLSDVTVIEDVGVTALVGGVVDLGWPDEPWVGDPAVLDGLLQLGLLWTDHALGGPSLPTAIGSIRLWSRPGPGLLQAMLTPVEVSAARVRSHIRAVGENGAPVIELANVDTYLLPRRPI